MLKYLLLPFLLAAPATAAEPPTAAMLAGNLAQTLSQTLTDNDALRARVKELEAQVTAAKAPTDHPAQAEK